jgi:hypothetical protein
MATRDEGTELVHARLCARFPGETAEVTRQLTLAIACAEHLGIRVTADALEGLVAERLDARAATRPVRFRMPPAVPLVVPR